MARLRSFGSAPLIILLILLIIFLIIGGLIWFDILGIINLGTALGPILEAIGLREPESISIDYSDFELLDSMSIQKRELSIALRLEDLETNREIFLENLSNYEEQLAQLSEREKNLENREISFNKQINLYDDRRTSLIQNARDLTSMRPEDAVAILIEYEDQLLIDTLRTVQELADEGGTFSLVPTYLSLFPGDRAAVIQRKMTQKPQGDSGSF